MARIKLILEYDGSNYHGFQIQKNAPTIQEKLEQGIFRLTGEKASLLCAGRTDAGVHALGQVVAFDTQSNIPPAKWKFALNSVLPSDIQVLDSQEVNPVFHPRYHAVKKKYLYLIYRREQGTTFYRKYAFCTAELLDVGAMRKSCQMIEGRHNFRSFCASGSSVKDFVRTVTRCRLRENKSYIKMEIEADGFLYKMVRIIMGTLLEVGRGNYPAEYIKEIIGAQDRSMAGPTAPPQGLYLVSVDYLNEGTV